jgi:E3 ubiquitin-protein ligase RBBP6
MSVNKFNMQICPVCMIDFVLFFSGVRTALLESEDNECPECKEKGTSPGSLIPNRFLRNSVNAFRNETGYNKPRQPRVAAKPKPVVAEEMAEAPEAEEEAGEEGGDNFQNLEEGEGIEGEGRDMEGAAIENPDDELTRDGADANLPGTPVYEDKGGENESDYEDNITVTVPPPHLQSRGAYSHRHINGRHGRPTMHPPGIETPPKHSHSHVSTSVSSTNSIFTNLFFLSSIIHI